MFARGARDDTARDPGEGDGVVAGRGARLVGRYAVRGAVDAGVPVGEVLDLERPRHRVEAGLVTHRLRDGDAVLAVDGELRPVLRDGNVVFDEAAVGEDVDGQGGEALRHREAAEEAVALDGTGVVRPHPPGDSVDDHLAVLVGADLRANLAPVGDLPFEELVDFGVEGGFVAVMCGSWGRGGWCLSIAGGAQRSGIESLDEPGMRFVPGT